MAGEFLKSHGIDIDAEMARIQNGAATGSGISTSSLLIRNVSLPCKEANKGLWNVHVGDGSVWQVSEVGDETMNLENTNAIDGKGALLAPSLCHPHIHLDKAFLLSHPKYAHLQIEKGDFEEAMTLTGKAKSMFEHQDLLERGQRVLDESVAAGVTHLRSFVELDAGVHTKCLDAGLELRKRASAEKSCYVQLCAFAQLPLFSATQDDEDGTVIRHLMGQAAENDEVEAIGSTPYVEADREKMKRNVEWMVDLSIDCNKHLDFHLDYNLDSENDPMVWHVLDVLIDKKWTSRTNNRTIVLGHCTRLTLFSDEQWQELADKIASHRLPISFVGLPTSDLFMMRTGMYPEIRGTLDIPRLIKHYRSNACIGANNIGNAFTPQGSCDPLSLACQGVGIYQAGTAKDTELLYECVSSRAKAAIGVGDKNLDEVDLNVEPGSRADLILFGAAADSNSSWRTRSGISTAVYLYDHRQARRVLYEGKQVSS